jgi:methylenetetrahydrofolate dehydrogenase (NADP+) / methenyltetrahydrofolate cyclohydrolase
MAEILDGKAIAAALRAKVAVRVEDFVARAGRKPGLDVVLVGEDPASQVYVRNKARACEEAGMRGEVHRLPATVTREDLQTVLRGLEARDDVDGVLVQLPLPKHLDEAAIIESLDPARDVDGLHPANAGMLLAGRPTLVPCTPLGCMRMLDHAGVSLDGARAIVIGRSNIVGKPMGLLLLARNATVTLAHSRTKDLAARCAESDVIVAAVGRPGLVRGDWVKPGAVVLDVGINRTPEGKLVGDVNFDEARAHASWITPVPGGVGPMTIACLLENTLRAAWRRKGLPIGELGL